MAVSTKRKNSLKTKSNSKTRKQFKKFRKTKKNIRKMKGGDGDEPKELDIIYQVKSVSFSPTDKTTICVGTTSSYIFFWNTKTNEKIHTLKGHKGSVDSVSFSSDGEYICSGSDDNTVGVWYTHTHKKGGNIYILKGHTSAVSSVAFSSNWMYIGSGSLDNTVRLWDTLTGNLKRTLKGHTGIVYSVAFSPDGEYICSGSADKNVCVWKTDTETDDPIRTLTGHKGDVKSVSFSPTDKTTICSGSYDKTVRLWNVDSGKNISILLGHTHNIWSVSFSPDGKYICSVSYYNTVLLWNTETGLPFHSFHSLNSHTGVAYSVSFSPNGEYICSGGTSSVLWNVKEIIKEEEKKEKLKKKLKNYFGEDILKNSISLDIIIDPHIASDGKSYTPDEFKNLFPEGNTTFIPNSLLTGKPLKKINPNETETEYYKKFLIKNFMLEDVLEYIAKKKSENSLSLDIIIDPHIASDGKSYTPDEFKNLFPEGNTTFIPNSLFTGEPLKKINPNETETEYYKKFLIQNYMLKDVLEYIAKKEKQKFSQKKLDNLWTNQTITSQTI